MSMGIFLLDVHDWQVLPANSVQWGWFIPFSAPTNTVMVMTVAISRGLTIRKHSARRFT